MGKRNSPDKKQKQNKQNGTGCVRETPLINMKPAWDV